MMHNNQSIIYESQPPKGKLLRGNKCTNPKHTNPINYIHDENRMETIIGLFLILVNELLTTHYTSKHPKRGKTSNKLQSKNSKN